MPRFLPNSIDAGPDRSRVKVTSEPRPSLPRPCSLGRLFRNENHFTLQCAHAAGDAGNVVAGTTVHLGLSLAGFSNPNEVEAVVDGGAGYDIARVSRRVRALQCEVVLVAE